MLAAAEAGDPSAFVALAGIVADLRKVHERLERTAEAAKVDNQRLAVASLSSQQLRAAEMRAKIGGVGSYAPQRGREGGEPVMFSLTIDFGDKKERFEMMPAEVPDGPQRGPVLEIPALTTVGSGVVSPLEPIADEEDCEFDEEV